MSDPTRKVTIYAWPEKWKLPSLQPESLAAILALQLSIPGEFTVKHCSNPDLSPSGQLPYLDIDGTCISSIQSIFRKINRLGTQTAQDDEESSSGLNAFLSRKQLAQETAWIAYAQAHLGDLVAHVFYASSNNFRRLTRPTIASLLPVPQRHYIADRIRASYKPRLESVDLWDISNDEDKSTAEEIGAIISSSKEEIKKREKHRKVIAKEKLLDRAKTSLDVISRTLDINLFFFGDRPSTIDALIAAHILLLLKPPFSDTTLRDSLNTSYPSLVQYANRVFDAAMGQDSVSLRIAVVDNGWANVVQNLAPKWPWSRDLEQSSTPIKSKVEKSDEEKRWDRMRWGWYTLAGVSTLAWILFGSVRFSIATDVDEEDDVGIDNDENAEEDVDNDAVHLEEDEDED